MEHFFANSLVFFTETLLVTCLAVLYIFIVAKIAKEDRIAYLLLLISVAIKIGFCVLVALAKPSLMLPPDAHRYLYEISRIAEFPWEWNPLTGSGPFYSKTPKMGMSYLYGMIMFLFGAKSLLSVVAINVFLSSLTVCFTYRLTKELSSFKTAQWFAICWATVHPEILFWSARVLRENTSIMCVTLAAYMGVLILNRKTTRPLVAGAILLFAFMAILRAQLLTILPIFVAYLMVTMYRDPQYRKASIALFVLCALATPLFMYQIHKASGLTLPLLLEGKDISQVLYSFGEVAKLTSSKYGPLGAILLPFATMTYGSFIFSVAGNKVFFREARKAAGFVIVLVVGFYAVLSFFDAQNIRFRSNVTPLIVALGSVVIATLANAWKQEVANQMDAT